MNIGLISDTHGHLDPKIKEYLSEVDEIWHAGDFGTMAVIEELEAFKPLKGVYGNIDGGEIRRIFPLDLEWEVEGLKVYMTHIGGYPKRYNPRIKNRLLENKPDIFICGHSHILKVMRDPKIENMLCLNPGAAGKHGFHKIKTLLRFEIIKGQVKNMEVVELGQRGALST